MILNTNPDPVPYPLILFLKTTDYLINETIFFHYKPIVPFLL